jgi:uncharacterized membrane protein YsdA (DUF1294 family)
MVIQYGDVGIATGTVFWWDKMHAEKYWRIKESIIAATQRYFCMVFGANQTVADNYCSYHIVKQELKYFRNNFV